MYSFVFLWTMSMSPNKEAIKHGLVFVNFMTASMLGSFLAGVLMKRSRPEAYMKGVFAVATAALLVPTLLALDTTKRPELKGKPITRSGQVQLLAFCVFEACVGVFWPTMMKLRADYVPEELRATIINIFRVPLNLFVCVVLGNVEAFPLAGMFGLCVAFMAVSLVSGSYQLRAGAPAAASSSASAGVTSWYLKTSSAAAPCRAARAAAQGLPC